MSNGLLHHIEINVMNLKETQNFWEWFLEKLDYVKFQEWEKGVSWKKGDIYIVFVEVEERYRPLGYHRSAVGLNHLAFHLNDKSELESFKNSLMKRKVPLLYMDKYPYAGGANAYTIFFEDPNRIKVELIAPLDSVI